MMINGLLIPMEALESAGLKERNLSIIVDDGEIRIFEDDEEFCCGFCIVEGTERCDEERKDEERDVIEKQILNKKSTVYIPADLRRSLGFESGNILELLEVEEGLLLRKKQ